MMIKVDDLLVCWRLEKYSHIDEFIFISIEKVYKINENTPYSYYYYYDLVDKTYSWEDDYLPFDKGINYLKLDDFLNETPNELKPYDKIFKKLFKGFFKKYKVDGRKFKLKLLN
jgi:hypothetical protein